MTTAAKPSRLADILAQIATAPSRAALVDFWTLVGMRTAASLDRDDEATAWHAYQKARDAFDAWAEVP